MRVLGLETSCDETAAAIVDDGHAVRSNIIASQVDLHDRFGGVVPELASRKHLERILPVIDEALDAATTSLGAVDAVAVTYGPGLVGALAVGVATAKAIALSTGRPLVGVNHLEGHIYANFLEHADIVLPAIVLIVSGAHTDLVLMRAHGVYEILGRTRDDAAGEAFDKIARAMGLGYPGGPAIDRLAQAGDPQAIELPLPFANGGLDFSFSGFKTAVLRILARTDLRPQAQADLAASVQRAIVQVLVSKTLRAVKRFQPKSLLVAGGVAANSHLRTELAHGADQLGVPLFVPSPVLCTDNAAMIAGAGFFRISRGQRDSLELTVSSDAPLGAEL